MCARVGVSVPCTQARSLVCVLARLRTRATTHQRVVHSARTLQRGHDAPHGAVHLGERVAEGAAARRAAVRPRREVGRVHVRERQVQEEGRLADRGLSHEGLGEGR